MAELCFDARYRALPEQKSYLFGQPPVLWPFIVGYDENGAVGFSGKKIRIRSTQLAELGPSPLEMRFDVIRRSSIGAKIDVCGSLGRWLPSQHHGNIVGCFGGAGADGDKRLRDLYEFSSVVDGGEQCRVKVAMHCSPLRAGDNGVLVPACTQLVPLRAAFFVLNTLFDITGDRVRWGRESLETKPENLMKSPLIKFLFERSPSFYESSLSVYGNARSFASDLSRRFDRHVQPSALWQCTVAISFKDGWDRSLASAVRSVVQQPHAVVAVKA
ncbi:hypothetical protein C8J57DRAFT_1225121 [Mycena rebaudengoi]|nr:hypothetical protein C8J57DRAFT_1225121 [Mycena rebaudengoi]